MTSKEWEKHTLEEDRKIRKKIDKYRNKGTNRVILGLLIALFGFDSLNDVIKQFTKVATEYTKTAGKKNMSLDVIAGAVKAGSQETDGRLAMAALAFILLALAVFFWAVTARNKLMRSRRKCSDGCRMKLRSQTSEKDLTMTLSEGSCLKSRPSRQRASR